MIHYRH